MAVNKSERTCKMILKVATGMNAKGDAVYRQRSFAHINPDLADEEFLAIGNQLAGLQEHTLGGVVRQDVATIRSQG